ncbi:MAG: hypothetical protein QGF74_03465 [Candidatus Nanoarchaeia archaeon]|jgi:hypothetical protein|nr:hypothetical protein [Candidatus Nanoarchaeia archaeon]|tara:strand:- start:45337 stop:45663 length:327 start_codon:yes stop_codon:yes gene_type:complete
MIKTKFYENLGIGTSIGFTAGLAVNLICNIEPFNFDLNNYVQDVIRLAEIIPYSTTGGFFLGGLNGVAEFFLDKADIRRNEGAKKLNSRGLERLTRIVAKNNSSHNDD